VTSAVDPAFADFVASLRVTPPEPVPRDQRVNFSGISFEEPGSFFPLRDCVVEKSSIVGQAFWMSWCRVSMQKVDFSHTRGYAHWTQCDFTKIKFYRLHPSLSVADCIFESCDFNGSVWTEPVFIRCTFRRLSLKGLAFERAIFIACKFEDVDLGESRWYDSRTLEIMGAGRASWVIPPTRLRGVSSPRRVAVSPPKVGCSSRRPRATSLKSRINRPRG
jgi:uncharacterized protein YjbI with pentapeptide repeats